MPAVSTLDSLDTAAAARALSQLTDGDHDLVDAYFERIEEVELPAEGEAPGFRLRREEGLAVRLVRDGRSWLSARDELSPEAFADALRQVARALPSAFYPEPRLDPGPWPEAPSAEELAELPLEVARAIRAHHVAFPLRLTARRHRREIQVVGPRLVPDPEVEVFYSLEAELPWGRWGALLPGLAGAGEAAAEPLVERFRCRNASPPEARADAVVVLSAGAAAVLLHEAVGHALEADTLALTGRPEAAVGFAMGPEWLSVLDDPGSAPEPVRRRTDDEGAAVSRRWLLRSGVVEQPLADRVWSRGSEVLAPGAARRASRHEPPGPRSTHLELLPGEAAADDLAAGADGGFLVSQVSRGALDPATGRFVLEVPCARRIRRGTPADPVGRFRIEGTVAGLTSRVAAVGREARPGGAGWCAKGGRKLPVWATAPALRLEGVEVVG
ncbi:MAG TPA: metallopeptidase TldD-related protein [Thermoanaerobaculia bacterium]|nr:metallopeptidase TldD-related protein [Thermoanaerobaculia bacterium]